MLSFTVRFVEPLDALQPYVGGLQREVANEVILVVFLPEPVGARGVPQLTGGLDLIHVLPHLVVEAVQATRLQPFHVVQPLIAQLAEHHPLQ